MNKADVFGLHQGLHHQLVVGRDHFGHRVAGLDHAAQGADQHTVHNARQRRAHFGARELVFQRGHGFFKRTQLGQGAVQFGGRLRFQLALRRELAGLGLFDCLGQARHHQGRALGATFGIGHHALQANELKLRLQAALDHHGHDVEFAARMLQRALGRVAGDDGFLQLFFFLPHLRVQHGELRLVLAHFAEVGGQLIGHKLGAALAQLGSEDRLAPLGLRQKTLSTGLQGHHLFAAGLKVGAKLCGVEQHQQVALLHQLPLLGLDLRDQAAFQALQNLQTGRGHHFAISARDRVDFGQGGPNDHDHKKSKDEPHQQMRARPGAGKGAGAFDGDRIAAAQPALPPACSRAAHAAPPARGAPKTCSGVPMLSKRPLSNTITL